MPSCPVQDAESLAYLREMNHGPRPGSMGPGLAGPMGPWTWAKGPWAHGLRAHGLRPGPSGSCPTLLPNQSREKFTHSGNLLAQKAIWHLHFFNLAQGLWAQLLAFHVSNGGLKAHGLCAQGPERLGQCRHGLWAHKPWALGPGP